MSDGGGESGRDRESKFGKSRASSVDDFGRAISRISVAQLCESTGFHSIHVSALDAFSDVVIRYISDLGKTAQFYANLSGRTECNVFDIVQGLEDLGSSYGFPGVSDADHCLASSGVIREIAQYISTEEEIPFARSVPRFPVTRTRNNIPSFEQIGETPPGSHIPSWLPALPDPHTFIHTPVSNERVSDPKEDKIEQLRQRRKAERSLLSLQQRLADSDVGVPSQAEEARIEKGKKAFSSAGDANPFLSPPLSYGEKEVSKLVSPVDNAVKKTISVLDTFAPVIEAVKSGAFDLSDSGNKALPSKRPAVQFKLGINKKTLVVPAPLFLETKGSMESDSWFLRDDGKDDKKRRAKLILKESMENPQELHQL